MGFEAKIIEFLQSGANDVLSFFVLALTYLGDEIFFMVVAVITYWCVNKRFAFKFVNIYLLGAAATEGIKVLFKRQRPFQKYENIKSIGEETQGYSFISGHSNSIANISTQMYLENRKTKHKTLFLGIGIVLTVIVMFSRLYLGQHYLTDVLAGCAFGIGFAVLFNFLFELLKTKEEWIVVVIVPLCLIIFIIISIIGFDSGADIMKVLGAYIAFTSGYFLEKRYVKYEVKSGKLWKQLIKIVLGLAVVIGLKEGLKFVFPETIPQLYAFLRYFIITFFAAFLAPLIFKACKI